MFRIVVFTDINKNFDIDFQAPKKIFNSPDPRISVLAKSLSLMKEDEVKKEEKVVFNDLTMDNIFGENIAHIHKQVAGKEVLPLDIEDIVLKYDKQEVLLVFDIRDKSEDYQMQVANGIGVIEKANFVVISNPEETIIKDISDKMGFEVYKQNMNLLYSDVDLDLPKWDGNFNPIVKMDKLNKAKIQKMEIPAKNIEQFLEIIRDRLQILADTGVFGQNVSYIYVSPYDITEDKILIEVESFDPEKEIWDYNYFGVYWQVKENDIILGDVFSAEREVVIYDPEREEIQIVPKNEKNEQEGRQVEFPKELEYLSKTKAKIIKSFINKNDEERFILGVVLEPNDGKNGVVDPDAQGDVYSAEDIRKASYYWFVNYQKIGLQHEEEISEVLPVESYIMPIDTQMGEQFVKKGSWMLGAVVKSDDLWAKIKAGEITGWSIGGYAEKEPV